MTRPVGARGGDRDEQARLVRDLWREAGQQRPLPVLCLCTGRHDGVAGTDTDRRLRLAWGQVDGASRGTTGATAAVVAAVAGARRVEAVSRDAIPVQYRVALMDLHPTAYRTPAGSPCPTCGQAVPCLTAMLLEKVNDLEDWGLRLSAVIDGCEDCSEVRAEDDSL